MNGSRKTLTAARRGEPFRRAANAALVGLVLIWAHVPLLASSLAVVNSGDAIVLAADSKETDLEGRGTTSNACKISPLGNGVVFAAAGVRGTTGGASGESVRDASRRG